MLQVSWTSSPHHGLTPVPISTHHSCDQPVADRSAGSFSVKGRGGCCGVWGRRAAIMAQEGEGQHSGTDALSGCSFLSHFPLLMLQTRKGGSSCDLGAQLLFCPLCKFIKFVCVRIFASVCVLPKCKLQMLCSGDQGWQAVGRLSEADPKNWGKCLWTLLSGRWEYNSLLRFPSRALRPFCF